MTKSELRAIVDQQISVRHIGSIEGSSRSKRTGPVYENKACKRYCDNVLNYQIIGNTMEISRIDYPVGLEYPSYAECAKEAKKGIMQMIAPAGTVAKGATYDVN